MSNDLISRKALMKIISETIDGRRMPEYDCDGFPITLSLSEIKKFIRQAPTAYDVDAVCEELSKRADESREYWQKYDDEQAFGEIEAYCESIMVVRNGGEKSENKNP